MDDVLFPAELHKQLSVSQQKVASQNQKMSDLESQLSQTNNHLASEIKTKDQSIALKVRTCTVCIYCVLCECVST